MSVTTCVRCKAVGFIRREHIIEKNTAFTQFYCGRCHHSWRVADGVEPDDQRFVKNGPRDDEEPSDR